MQGLAQRYGVNRDTLARSRLGRPAGRRVGGCGAQSEYITVRSVVCDRAESSGAQQVAATGPQIPQAYIGRTVWPAVQVPCEHQREQADVPGEVADRVVLGDRGGSWPLRSRNARESLSEPARRGRRRTASRSAWSPCPAVWPRRPSATANSLRPPHAPHSGCPAGLGRPRALARTALSSQRAVSGFMARHGQPRTPPLLARRLPSAAGQIRKTCGVPAYLRVVIEKHRTQASRTMNAEPAQAAADRVD